MFMSGNFFESNKTIINQKPLEPGTYIIAFDGILKLLGTQPQKHHHGLVEINIFKIIISKTSGSMYPHTGY